MEGIPQSICDFHAFPSKDTWFFTGLRENSLTQSSGSQPCTELLTIDAGVQS